MIVRQQMHDWWPAGGPVRHLWDDWDPYPAFGLRSDETEFRLLRLSDRARIAFAIGCAAWTIARFEGFTKLDEAWEYLDAAWLCQVSEDYVVPAAPEDSQWEGPVRGPIHLSLITVENCFAGIEEENSEIDASFAELIPLHVLSDTQHFIQWRLAELELLDQVSPREEGLGEPLPPQILAARKETEALKEMRACTTAFFDEVLRGKNHFLRRV